MIINFFFVLEKTIEKLKISFNRFIVLRFVIKNFKKLLNFKGGAKFFFMYVI